MRLPLNGPGMAVGAFCCAGGYLDAFELLRATGGGCKTLQRGIRGVSGDVMRGGTTC